MAFYHYNIHFRHLFSGLSRTASRCRPGKTFLLIAVFAVSLMVIGGGAEVQHASKLGQIVASEPTPYRLTGGAWSILDLSAPQSGYAFAQTPDSTPPTFVSSELDTATRVLRITFSETIDAANVDAAMIHIRESGTYSGGVTLTDDELGTAADANTISFILTRQHLGAVAELDVPELTIDPGAVQDTSGNLIVGTFDVSTAEFAHSFSVTGQDSTPTGMAFSKNGAKMFVVGRGYGGDIYEYTLPTPFNFTSAAPTHSLDVSGQETKPQGMAFSNDGTKMFVIGDIGNDINEYTLSAPFDLSTANFTDFTLPVPDLETRSEGMAFSNNGTKMFVVGRGEDAIYEYTLDTPFDLSTAIFANVTLSVVDEDQAPTGMAFSNDGAKMFVVGRGDGGNIHEYTLDTPFDLSTAIFANFTFALSVEQAPGGMAFSNDGAKMFVADTIGGAIYEYTLSSVYPIGVIDSTPPTFVSSELDIETRVLRITFSETINATNVDAAKIHIRESGNYTGGGIILTDGELGTTADANTISFILTTQHLATVTKLRTPELTIEPGAVQDTSGNLIVGTFDVSTATHVYSFSVTSEDIAPTGMAFSNNGTKMFIVGAEGVDISEYTLSTPFELSAAEFAHVTFNVSKQDTKPEGMAFSNDGTKMFVVGDQHNRISEYTLSIPFNVTDAAHVHSFNVSGQETAPLGMAFSNDGAKMFVIGDIGNDINEYTLTIPFNVTTAAHVHSFPVGKQESAPRGMAFSNDGAKMFVIGDIGNDINEYTLTIPFNVTTASYDGNDERFSVFTQDKQPTGMAFSNDGAKMFVVGWNGDAGDDAVNEYTLSSVYPIVVTENPPPTFISSELATEIGVLTITFSETINATNVDATKIHIRESGNYTGGGITLTAARLDTTTDASTISFNLTEQHREAVTGLRVPELTIEPGAVQDTFGNLIVGTFDVSTATYTGVTFDVSVRDQSPKDVAFSNDGTKMFVVGSHNEAIYEYTLSTPFKLSTATYNGNTEIFLLPNTFPTGMAFSNDGTKMFVAGDEADNIHEYTLSTPFDVSTASHVDSLHVYAQEEKPQGVAFSNDGAKMFVVGNDGQEINEYTLTTPFDLTAPPFANFTFSVLDQDTNPEDMAFSNDGAKMFVVGNDGDSIYEYTLSTPFDVSTASHAGNDERFSVTTQDRNPTGMAFSNDGAKMFVVGNADNDINEYTLSSVYPIVSDAAVLARVTSDTRDGDYGPGTKIDVRLDFAEPVGLDIVPVADSQHVLPGRFYQSATFQADGRHYAVLPSASLTAYHAIEIADITDPNFPRVVAMMINSTDFPLDTPRSVDMASIGGYQYAIVMTNYEQFHIINVTDPKKPSAVGTLLDVSGNLNEIYSPTSVSAFQIGNYHYALVTGTDATGVDHFFSMINITNPGSPSLVGVIGDMSGPFAGFDAYSPGSFPVQIGEHHYAAVPTNSALVMLNITDPASLTRAGVARSGQDGFGEFAGGISAVVEVDGHHYELIGSTSNTSLQGLTIINITDPASLSYVASLTRSEIGSRYNVKSITSAQVDGSHYALLLTNADITIINITDPASPSTVAILDEAAPTLFDSSPRLGRDTVTTGGRHYVPVTTTQTGWFSMLDITDPANPAFGRAGGLPVFDELEEPFEMDVIEIGGIHYALVAALRDDGVQIINMSDPSYPVPAAGLTDGQGGFETLGEPSSIAATKIGEGYYALVAASEDRGIQIIDITDPANPSPEAAITNTTDGFGAMNYPTYVAVTEIDGAHYALVSDSLTVYVINVTDPGSPVHVASLTDGQDGFNLNYPDDIAFADIGNTTYAMVIVLNDSILQMIDLSDPANPVAAGFASGDADGFGAFQLTDVASAEIGGRHYALVASPYDGDIQIIDVTNPDILYPTATFTESLDTPVAVEFMESGGAHYALVADTLDGTVDFIAVINVTNPARPSLVANVTSGRDGFGAFGFPHTISVMESGGAVYALVLYGLGNGGMTVIDVTDPANPSNPFLPHLKLDLEGGRAVYAGQEDDHSLTFRYLTTPDDHTVDLSYEGTGALHLGRGVLTYADDGLLVSAELPEPGKPDSLSYEKQIRVYGTDPKTHFVTTWEVASRNGSVTIPDGGTGGPYTVYWGDGEKDRSSSGDRSHVYTEAGNYTVAVSEGISKVRLGDDAANAAKLRSIVQWGSNMWTGMAEAFRGASQMMLAADDAPDLSGVDSTAHMFRDSSINADLSDWGVSSVTSMSSMFRGAAVFDGDLSDWDVSSVTDATSMFQEAESFNQDVSDWYVSSVTDAPSMFQGATSFNQDLSDWDISSVTDMSSMFQKATSFNQNLSGWDISSAKDMSSMFDEAISFDQNLGIWYVTMDDTSIDGTDVPGIVGTISAQNVFLDGQEPVYGIMAEGPDSERFAVFDGDQLFMVSLNGSQTEYVAKIMASGPQVFEDGNNWVDVRVSVPGGAPSTSLTVEAGVPQSANEGDTVTLSGSATGAPPQNSLTYQWAQISPGNLQAVLANVTAPVTTFVAPQVESDTIFTFILNATDGTDSASDLTRVTVLDVTTGPAPLTVHAESIVAAREGDSVTLSGSAAGAPQGSVTYRWVQTSPASPQVSLGDAAAQTVTFDAPSVESDTTFTFTLNATDGSRSATDMARVTVLDAATDQGLLTVHAEANHAAYEGTRISLSGSAAGAPQDSVTYRWVQTSPASPQASLGDATARTVTFDAPSVESETVFTFTLNAAAGSRSATDLVTVTVLDVAADQGLLTVHAEANHAAYEGSRISLSGSAAGAPQDSVTYRWVQTSPASPQASLGDAAARTVTFDAPLVESDTTFTFTLNATAGNRSATDLVTVTVLDVSGPAVPGTTVIVPDAGGAGAGESRNRSSAPMGIDDNMTIDGQRYGIGSRTDTIRPHDVTTGKTTDIEFTAYSTEKIIHFTMYLNLHKDDTRHSDSDTYISYDNGAVKTRDPHNFVSDASIIITGDEQQPNKKIIRVLVEFEGNMGMTDMILYAWNEDRSSVLVRTHDILNVTPGTAVTEPAPPDPEPGITVAEPLEPDSGLPADPEPVTPDFAGDAADPEPVPSDTLWPDDYDDAQVLHIIRMWSGFEAESITDTQMLELLGLEDYQDVDLPDWMMTELGVLVAMDAVTVDEFMLALQYVLEHA